MCCAWIVEHKIAWANEKWRNQWYIILQTEKRFWESLNTLSEIAGETISQTSRRKTKSHQHFCFVLSASQSRKLILNKNKWLIYNSLAFGLRIVAMRVQEKTNEITTDAYITITKQSEEKKLKRANSEWDTEFRSGKTDGTTYQAHKTYRSELAAVRQTRVT